MIHKKHACIAILLILIASESYSIEIGVVDSEETGIIACTKNTSDHISNLATLTVNDTNTIIKLCQKVTFLNSTLTIENNDKNITNVTLTGFSAQSIINCLGNTGILFMSIPNLIITNVAFQNCGCNYKGQTSAVFIIDSTDLMLDSAHFLNSRGSGLMLHNTTRSASIINSDFNMSREGGGLYVIITGLDSAKYRVYKCHFHNNCADGRSIAIGGGLTLDLENTSSITITLDKITFEGNVGGHYGGGGLSISFKEVRENNSLMVTNSDFFMNTASIGGGVMFSSTKTLDNTQAVTLVNCNLGRNKAYFGSAIGILPHFKNTFQGGHYPEITFSTVNLTSNIIRTRTTTINPPFTQYEEGNGALYCSEYFTKFKGELTISNNNGSAFYMIRCGIEFDINSTILFANNSGYYGGAIHLISSQIIVNTGTTAKFYNNTAFSTGGAIHFYSEEFSFSRFAIKCFIVKRKNTNKHTVEFTFSNNTALTKRRREGKNNSIHAVSFLPCIQKHNKSSIAEAFAEVGKFTFSPNSINDELSTLLNHTLINSANRSTFPIIPGKPTKLPITAKNQLNRTIPYLYETRVDSNSQVRALFTSNNTLIVKGKPGEDAKVYLSTKSSLRIVLLLKVHLQNCPPGFEVKITHDNQNECQCSNNYFGIVKCDNLEYTALAKHGIYVGYTENETGYQLITGYCPIGFCKQNHESKYKLPSEENIQMLTDAVCEANRKGILCGQCKENLTTHYHSPSYRCGSKSSCHLGWLFYILSELLPITAVFTLIILYEIPLTSGLVNGFILYAQVIVTILQGSSSFTVINNYIKTLSQLHTFFYNMFQLQFFAHDKLSFCIWKDLNALDILAINYVTLLYALVLIVALILMLKYCFTRCNSQKRKFLKSNFVHGLSAFFVLFYSKTAYISIFLLRKSSIFTKGSEKYKDVLYFYGNYKWFGNEHYRYAIPSILVITFIVVIPTILLLVYPLHYKTLRLLKISESKSAKILLRIVPLERLKPFFDSFQGSFKDKYRFFAGLYFVYRFLILLNVALNEVWVFFVVGEIQYAIMLMLTALCQPYKSKLHNIIDCLLFGNLTVINALNTYANYLSYNARGNSMKTVNISQWLLLLLIYLPFIAFVLAVVIKLTKSCKGNEHNITEEDNFIELRERSPSVQSPPCEESLELTTDYSNF